MVQLHFDRNAVTCKIVYYGPGLSGKTTNLEIIHQKAPQDSRGEMVSIATRGDRTLYFDYLPLDLGQVQGMNTTFQLYTVPGQIYYNNTRKLVLQGVDGVVFVADSSASKMDENRESLSNLQDNLQAIGLSLADMPMVIQYNKRDLPDAMPVAELDALLNQRRRPTFEAVAKDGQGVFVTLKEIGRLVIERINTNQAPRRRTGNAVPRQATDHQTGLPQAIPTPKSGANKPFPTTPAGSQQTPTQRMDTVQESPRFQSASASGRKTQPLPQPPSSDSSGKRRAAGTKTGGSASPRSTTDGTRRTSNAPSPAGGSRRPSSPAGGSRQASAPASSGPVNPREKHLKKAKPPSLSQRRSKNVKDLGDLGSTEPHLKKYRTEETSSGSRFFRFILGLFFAILSLVIIVAILTLFVRPVNELVVPLLPAGLQEVLRHGDAEPPPPPPTNGPSTPDTGSVAPDQAAPAAGSEAATTATGDSANAAPANGETTPDNDATAPENGETTPDQIE